MSVTRGTRLLLNTISLVLLAGVSACTDSPGPATDTVEVAEIALPSYTITVFTPTDNLLVAQASVLVSGRVDGATQGTVTVNDVDATRGLPLFSAWIPIAEGSNELVITYSPPDASAVTHTLNVALDSLPPILNILAPPRGWVAKDVATVDVFASVHDESGLATLSAASLEVSLPLEDDSQMLVAIPLSPGLNILPVQAVDHLSNAAQEHRTVLAGPLGSCEPSDDVPDMVLDLGNEALQSVGHVVGKVVDGLDLGSYLAKANPLYDSESIAVSVTSASLAGTSVIPSVADGLIQADVTVEKLSVAGAIQLKATGTIYLFDATVEELTAKVVAHFSLQDNDLDLGITDIQVEADMVQVSATDEQGAQVIAPVEVTGNFLGLVSDMLSGILLDLAQDIAATALAMADSSFTLSVFGQEVTVAYKLRSAVTTADAIRSEFSGLITLESPQDIHPWPHGCPQWTTAPPPDKPLVAKNHQGATLWLSYDFLNRTLIEMWRSGLFDFHWDQTDVDKLKLEIDLVCGLMGSLLDFLEEPVHPDTPMQVHVSSALPPLLIPVPTTDSPGSLELPGAAVGALALHHTKAPTPASQSPLTTVTLSVTCGIQAHVQQNILKLTPVLRDFYLDIDEGLSDDQKRLVERDIEAYFETLVPDLIGSLNEALLEIPLPTIYGIDIDSASLFSSPTGYLGLAGRLVTEDDDAK